MLDAYPGLSPNALAKVDQEKVNFITWDETFCYTMMPFGLKNVEVSYQRLMDKLFRQQIEWNIEVHVDDILIKSTQGEDLVANLEETFTTLHRYELKLNFQ